MSTIKIDRGFTQKVQHKAPVQGSSYPGHPPASKKKPSGGPSWVLIIGVAGAGVAVLATVLALVFGGGKKPAPAPAAPAPAAPAPAAVAQPAAATVKPPQSGPAAAAETEDASLYGDYKPRIMPAGASTQIVSFASNDNQSKRTQREIPMGEPQGLRCDYYKGIKGSALNDLRRAAKFPDSPDWSVQVGSFELSEGLGVDYGARVRGFVTPPKSGAYTFVMNVDDLGELWLSSDESPSNIRRVINLTKHTQHKWNNFAEQQSVPVELVAGKRYYLEAIFKQASGGDYLAVGWFGPVGDKITIIEAKYLQPWTEQSKAAGALSAARAAAAERRRSRADASAACEAVRAAVAEQMKACGAAHRYADAARALKANPAFSQGAAAQEAAAAAERFESLAQLKAFVQTEVTRTRPRGVWAAYGGGLADVTAASDAGVTVAPGRLVSWDKVPADQMLRLVNATVPKAQGDAATRGALLLAAAVYCKEVGGGSALALKYRESALAASPGLAAAADRLLGGSPEALLAEPLSQAAEAELAKLSASADELAARALKRCGELAGGGQQTGLLAEYWDNVSVSNLDELRNSGLTKSRPPDASQRLPNFEAPINRADRYVARISGYLTPRETGEYYFYICSDDAAEFWISPSERAEDLKKVVVCQSSVGRFAWDRERRRSEPIRLEKDRRYAVKALLREGGQSDHLEVGWSWAREDSPKLITGEYLTCSAAGVVGVADDVAKQASADADKAAELAAELLGLCEPEAAAPRRADELQKRAARAKEALREAEACLARVDAALAAANK